MQANQELKSSTCQRPPPQVRPLSSVLRPPSAARISPDMLLTSWLLSILLAGPVSVRCHPAPEAPSNSIGLEAIIRKALMGNFDEQSEERAPPSQVGGASVPAGAAVDARADDFFSQGALRCPPVLSDSPSPQASPSSG